MNIEKKKFVSRVIVAAIALTMLLPASVLSEQFTAEDAVEMVSQSTTIRFNNAGLAFDNTNGEPSISANMKAGVSDKYIVQFKGPIMSEWKQDLRDLGAKVHQYVEDYAYVVEMDDSTRTRVESMSTVGWVGIYQPAYKVDKQLNDMEGSVKLTVTSFGSASELASRLESFGVITDIQEDMSNVEIMTNSIYIPSIAQMSDVMDVYFQPEMELLNNRAGEVEGNHVLWDTTLSGLDQIITGRGVHLGITDSGWDNGDINNGHWDMTRGVDGSRMTYAEQDGDGHGTHCIGIMAGNGYCMEEYLGLDNMNRVYFESAATNPNPNGYDLQGFAGVAPEATVEAYDGMTTTVSDVMT